MNTFLVSHLYLFLEEETLSEEEIHITSASWKREVFLMHIYSPILFMGWTLKNRTIS